MNRLPTTIPKRPEFKPAQDYYRLRRDGIGHIERMGSALWTDYNTHDPGVTILESLCYALTDLAYRTGWDIQDLLAPATPAADPTHPFPSQPFFTAREILPVNPWTPDDYRRLLIDLDTIRNAWVSCKQCACDVYYYAWCEKDQLVLSYQKPANPLLQAKKVETLGFYEVLLELESDPELGDLNDRKLEHSYNLFDSDGKPHPVILELRFPDWGLGAGDKRDLFVNSDDAFTGEKGASFQLKVLHLGATKTYNVLTDPALDEAARNAYLQKHWRSVFYVSFEITLMPGGQHVVIPYAALRIFGDAFAKGQGAVAGLKAILEDRTTAGFIQRYRQKLLRVDQAVMNAKSCLQAHRNLDEDYCRISGIEVDDVAVCADVEVLPDADIELVQAKIWFEIEQYFNPQVPFYSLKELMDAGMPVEDMFNGPNLESGFIKASDLEAAELKSELRTSDIVNRLMDIEGVVAVNNLLLTKYDAEGHIVKGAADPTWQDGQNGGPVFEPGKASASWLLVIGDRHQPRLYHNLSRFLFSKNGLPFLPRKDEASDTFVQLRGEAERPKLHGPPEDLPIPVGTFCHPEDYAPIQYGFPLTYGIGREGLPAHASPARRAQAKQMKAYLMVFEQLLGNAVAQIANTAKLFSLDPTVDRTYFVKEFNEAMIQGYAELIGSGFNMAELEQMAETLPEFHERRNRFLDHIMARFGEQFGEYALLLTKLHGEQVALDRLIADKISFVNAYPLVSRDRGKAFDYTRDPCSPGNIPGLKKRVSLLLGYPDLTFSWTVATPVVDQYPVTFRLIDRNAAVWLEGGLTVTSTGPDRATHQAFRDIIRRMILIEAYDIVPEAGRFRLKVKDENGNVLGQHPVLFQTMSDANGLRDELVGWSSNERAVVVEHILLRPKFPGDALFPACTDGPCNTCGDEDPYSFRLTFVMPGWTAPFTTNLEMRDFADRTIRQETPSHLLGKTCWVGNDGFIENPCDPVIDELAELLITKGRTNGNTKPTETDVCRCALAIYKAFSHVFQKWYEDKSLTYFHSDALAELLGTEFRATVNPADVACAVVLDEALWADILVIMVKHFGHVVLAGWQFERFEEAWCKWLEVNAGFDWTEERVQDRVVALLRANLKTDPGAKTPDKDELCKCAAAIVTKYGIAFHSWMDASMKAGTAFESFPPFVPDPITLCAGLTFQPGTDTSIAALLKDRYEAYKETSYRLWIVVNLLASLSNTYPGARLHDCDGGSDENPVRLGKTALGTYPLRNTVSPSDSPGPAPSDRSTTQPRASGRQTKTKPAKPLKNGKRKRRS
ncbi:MAG: hypothetical protein P0121_07235 [Nitrospira sp.]|nr:hypothetical protein [Nitrospira sp.]